MKNIVTSLGAVYYVFMASAAAKQTTLFYSEPDREVAFKTWNLLDVKFIRHAMKLTYPYIKYNKKIRISREYPQITLEKLKKEIQEGTINKIDNIIFIKENKKNFFIDNQNGIKTNMIINSGVQQQSIFEKGPDKVTVRILSYKHLPKYKSNATNSFSNKNSFEGEDDINEELKMRPKKKGSIFSFFGCFSESEPSELSNITDKCLDGLIFHIHGGGFVSMSSFSHQSYTRE